MTVFQCVCVRCRCQLSGKAVCHDRSVSVSTNLLRRFSCSMQSEISAATDKHKHKRGEKENAAECEEKEGEKGKLGNGRRICRSILSVCSWCC